MILKKSFEKRFSLCQRKERKRFENLSQVGFFFPKDAASETCGFGLNS